MKRNICLKWLGIFCILSFLFLGYQQILSTSYVEKMFSLIGYMQEGTEIKTVLFLPSKKETVQKGIQIFKEAGYEETGRNELSQEITSYGQLFYFSGLFIICTAGAFTEIILEKKKEKNFQKVLECREKEISVQFQKEKDSIEAERQKMGKTMENLSHQLRTPITGTLLSLEYLLDTEEDAEKKERLDGCIEQVTGMSDMTQVLLRLAQIDSGKIWMNRKRENLTLLVEDCIHRTWLLAEEKQIEIRKELEASCILSCDRFWVKEAIENVLKNAVAFTPESGNISITLKKSEEAYDIRIFNSGSTLSSEDREKIFERFYQTDGNSGSGFGIGLHLAREIARLHQGNLRVLDTEKEGTTFQFLFPCIIAKDNSSLTEL